MTSRDIDSCNRQRPGPLKEKMIQTNMAFSFAGILVLGLFVVVPVLAVLIRLAIAIANRVIGPVASEGFDDTANDGWEDTARDLSNPFSPPAATSTLPSTTAIPMVSFGHAFLIALTQVFLGILSVTAVGLGFGALGLTDNVIGPIVAVAISFLIVAVILMTFVPTTFFRALLVTLITYAAAFAVFSTVGVVLYFATRVA